MERQFEQEVIKARAEYNNCENVPRARYLLGYIKGLKRNFFGENFGTLDEHMMIVSLKDELGDGYRAGLEFVPSDNVKNENSQKRTPPHDKLDDPDWVSAAVAQQKYKMNFRTLVRLVNQKIIRMQIHDTRKYYNKPDIIQYKMS